MPDPSVKHISFAMIWTSTIAVAAVLVMTEHPVWAGWIFALGLIFLPQRGR